MARAVPDLAVRKARWTPGVNSNEVNKGRRVADIAVLTAQSTDRTPIPLSRALWFVNIAHVYTHVNAHVNAHVYTHVPINIVGYVSLAGSMVYASKQCESKYVLTCA